MADEQDPPFMSRQQWATHGGGRDKVRASWDENEKQARWKRHNSHLFCCFVAFFFCFFVTFHVAGMFARRPDIYLGVAQSITGRAARPRFHGNLSTVAQWHKDSHHPNKFPEQSDEN